jgi:glycosyltransferase involved in cell wall biosynthesis
LADIVLSISEDTSKYLVNILNVPKEKIVLQRYSINHELFRPKDKKKIITYMPRKMADHSNRVVNALKGILPSDSWSIQAIENMNEQQVADSLSRSIIFLAFSEFEGLPVPPVEAALCGNYVIGYDGQGGKEYWKYPNFQKVEQGNIQDFIEKILMRIHLIDSDDINIQEINSGINSLAEHFSNHKELELIKEFISKAINLK